MWLFIKKKAIKVRTGKVLAGQLSNCIKASWSKEHRLGVVVRHSSLKPASAGYKSHLPRQQVMMAASSIKNLGLFFFNKPCTAFPQLRVWPSRVTAGVPLVPERGKLDPRDPLYNTLRDLQPWEWVGKPP